MNVLLSEIVRSLEELQKGTSGEEDECASSIDCSLQRSVARQDIGELPAHSCGRARRD